MQNDHIHWNQVYTQKPTETLGWYEVFPEASLKMIQSVLDDPEATILMVGAGVSSLLPTLLKAGYRNIIANDISAVALEKLKQEVLKTEPVEHASKQINIRYISDDLTKPNQLLGLKQDIDLWQDRAVLHFFTEEKDRLAYKQLLLHTLKPGGYALIATFYPNTASQCSNLPVRHYNEDDLRQFLGAEFQLKSYQRETYRMPSGETREFGYGLFQRVTD